MIPISPARLLQRLDRVSPATLLTVEDRVRILLGLENFNNRLEDREQSEPHQRKALGLPTKELKERKGH